MGRLKTKGLALEMVDGLTRVTHLCGLALAADGPPATQGTGVIETAGTGFERAALAGVRLRRTRGGAEALHRTADGRLEWTTQWQTDEATGVVARRDALRNTGAAPVMVVRCLARVALPPGQYEVYSQQSAWCRENQGAWQPLRDRAITLRHVSGRTSSGGTPYACIRETTRRQGLVFHVVPCGNWLVRVTPIVVPDRVPFAVVELGLTDEGLRLTLGPGERFALPEILTQPLPDGEPALAAPRLHAYALERWYGRAKPQAPVVYNTWFDHFEILDVPRLRRQLRAARAIGCEVFVVDAGWYGAGGASWHAQVGDWREKRDAVFRGRMRAFSREVRTAGLRFGLWMEPERVGAAAPVFKQHPDWFVPTAGGSARFDLTQPGVRAWLRDEIGRLIESYDLAWIKLDFNFDFDNDASGAALARYTAAWYGLLDAVRRAYPRTFFEGCASGALRLDLNSLSRFDGQFLSDSVDPVDMLRISQGAFLRLPPGRFTRWAVLRSPGAAVPRYGLRTADSPPTVLVPSGAGWEPCASQDLDFAVLAAMPGMLGFSGDLAGLPESVRQRLAAQVRFFKRHRRFLAGAVAHLLTPPEPSGAREGWVAFQFQNRATTDSLLFVYRLGTAGAAAPWRLRGLEPQAEYTLAFGADRARQRVTGKELMAQGLAVALPEAGGGRVNLAAVATLRRARTLRSPTRNA